MRTHTNTADEQASANQHVGSAAMVLVTSLVRNQDHCFFFTGSHFLLGCDLMQPTHSCQHCQDQLKMTSRVTHWLFFSSVTHYV